MEKGTLIVGITPVLNRFQFQNGDLEKKLSYNIWIMEISFPLRIIRFDAQ